MSIYIDLLLFGLGCFFFGAYLSLLGARRVTRKLRALVEETLAQMEKTGDQAQQAIAEAQKTEVLNKHLYAALVDVARKEATVEIGHAGQIVCTRTRDRALSYH